jgi:hypothetical protein
MNAAEDVQWFYEQGIDDACLDSPVYKDSGQIQSWAAAKNVDPALAAHTYNEGQKRGRSGLRFPLDDRVDDIHEDKDTF